MENLARVLAEQIDFYNGVVAANSNPDIKKHAEFKLEYYGFLEIHREAAAQNLKDFDALKRELVFQKYLSADFSDDKLEAAKSKLEKWLRRYLLSLSISCAGKRVDPAIIPKKVPPSLKDGSPNAKIQNKMDESLREFSDEIIEARKRMLQIALKNFFENPDKSGIDFFAEKLSAATTDSIGLFLQSVAEVSGNSRFSDLKAQQKTHFQMSPAAIEKMNKMTAETREAFVKYIVSMAQKVRDDFQVFSDAVNPSFFGKDFWNQLKEKHGPQIAFLWNQKKETREIVSDFTKSPAFQNFQKVLRELSDKNSKFLRAVKNGDEVATTLYFQKYQKAKEDFFRGFLEMADDLRQRGVDAVNILQLLSFLQEHWKVIFPAILASGYVAGKFVKKIGAKLLKFGAKRALFVPSMVWEMLKQAGFLPHFKKEKWPPEA